jgi:DNA-binding CsgD family transcriptional regulator
VSRELPPGTKVEVAGGYLNPEHNLEVLANLLAIVPSRDTSAQKRKPKQVQRRLRPAEIAELIAAYEAGASSYELAKQFRIHRHTVTQLLERQGVPRRYQSLTSEQVARATSLYESGLSLSAVGQELSCDPATVSQALRAAGVALRPRNGWKYD